MQADIIRAIRALNEASGDMAIEIKPDGTIRLVPVEPEVREPILSTMGIVL
jgi:hypothetical protein